MTVTLFTLAPGSLYGTSSEAIALYLNLPVKIVYSTFEGPDPEFAKAFPPNNRFYPAIIDTENNLAINQQVAVNRYLISLAKDKKGLLGASAADEARILQWTNRLDGAVTAKLLPIMMRRAMGNPLNDAELKAFFAQYDNRALDLLETHLSQNKFLLGDKFTLADIEGAILFILALPDASIKPPLLDIVNHFGGSPEWVKAHPNILRWINDVQHTEPFQLQAAAPRK